MPSCYSLTVKTTYVDSVKDLDTAWCKIVKVKQVNGVMEVKYREKLK